MAGGQGPSAASKRLIRIPTRLASIDNSTPQSLLECDDFRLRKVMLPQS